DAIGEASSGIFGSADLLGGLLSAFMPEARLGLGLSTFALVIMTIALLVYLGMIIYREFIRIRRWMARPRHRATTPAATPAGGRPRSKGSTHQGRATQ